MADILLDVQSPPSTPSAGQIVLYGDTLTKKIQSKNDAGAVETLGCLCNASTANQTGFAADTYLVGSSINIPTSLVAAKTIYRLFFDMVKTGAGTASFVITIRFGTAGSTADTARLTFTFAVGTAVADTGIFEVTCHFRVGGASATMAGYSKCQHALAATGLTTTGASGTGIILATASAFDATVANSIIGASINGGASFSGTNTVVHAEMIAA